MSAPAPLHVTVVEDDAELRDATAQALALEGAEVRAFPEARAALGVLTPDYPGVVVTDVRMPGMDGIALFERLRAVDASIPVILVTGHGDVEMAVEAMKNGAADFLTKPFATADLLRSVRAAWDRRRLALENRALREELVRAGRGARSILLHGPSPAAEQLRSLVEAVGGAEIDVVIDGARGVGKTAAARLIHETSPRAARPFVAIDNGVLAHEDAELLLFGRDPAAGLSRTGMIERANGGTLFLDDLDGHSDTMNARLLAMLDSRSVLPIGAERGRALNLRIVVARTMPSSHDAAKPPLSPEQRLGAVRVTVPSLADRREDIIGLFRFFVSRHEQDLGIESTALDQIHWEHLQNHDWPGNLRELDGYARAVVLGLPLHPATDPVPQIMSLAQRVASFERSVLDDGLRRHRGNVEALRNELQTPRKTLYDKLKRFGLEARLFRRGAEPDPE